ncbi:MAG: hypothetical protein UW55_C0028G0002 [Candidatus Giovannonibacteria bacterium GW2011_GWA2_44_26]|uniref:Uncharacterized protein n=1 Tax=Candidatus Giovannonibacteria bacterium GW2011_GWA2_44_26 TaxID=1618648 RepID=A0A0G1IRV1_9BACT|nr:MAG: hypothetical protein UW55_C0028G0002 [Candidatus Giovannonibacteria bacterium GW2011_GWA2_44_26]
MKKEKLIYASAIASVLSIVFVAILTIWADLNAPLKDYLKSLSGHHWVTKSYGTILIYFGAVLLFLILPKKIGEKTLKRSLIWLFFFVFAGTLSVSGFYVLHFLKVL